MDDGFVHRLRRVLLLHGEGIPLEGVPRAWQAAYEVPLLPEQLGFASCRALLAAMPQAAIIGRSPEQRVTAVVNAAGAEELLQHVRKEVESGGSGASTWDAFAKGSKPSRPLPPQQLALSGAHVSYEAVVAGMDYYLAGRSFQSLGLQPPQSLQELMYLDRRVGAAVTAFCAARAVVTLWELERHLSGQEAVPAYSALRLGPLAAHPAVRRAFFAGQQQQQQQQQQAQAQGRQQGQGRGQAQRAGPSGGPGPPPPPPPQESVLPDVAIPRITSYDIAAAVRRCVTRRPADQCRAAAAAGVGSAKGAELVAEVLADVAAAAGLDVAGSGGSGDARGGSGGRDPAAQSRAQQLSWRLGVLVSDLLLYVNIALAAMEAEQLLALRGAVGIPPPPQPSTSQQPGRPPQQQPKIKLKLNQQQQGPESQPPQAQERGHLPRAPPAAPTAGNGAGGGREGLPLPMTPQLYQFLSPTQQALLSRRQLKEMFIPSGPARPGAPHAAKRMQERAAAFTRGVSDALAALRQEGEQGAEQEEEDPTAEAAAGEDPVVDLCSSSSEDDSDGDGGHSDGGGRRRGRKRQRTEAHGGGSRGVAQGAEVARMAASIEDSGKLLNSTDAGLRRRIAEVNGLPPNFTEGQLQAAFQRVLRQALGGARVQPEPSPDFYPSVVAVIVEQFVAPVVAAQHEVQLSATIADSKRANPGSKQAKRAAAQVQRLRGADGVKSRVARQERALGTHPLVLMLLRALHAAMRGQLAVHDAQMAAVRQHEEKKEQERERAQEAAKRKGGRAEQQAQGGGGEDGSSSSSSSSSSESSDSSDSSSDSDESDGDGKGAKGAKEGPGRADGGDGSDDGSRSEDPDAPYIRDAAGRAALRGEALKAGRRRQRQRQRQAKAEEGEPAPALISTPALRGVVAAFQRVEAALTAARPAAGWSAEALARLREGLFAPAGSGGGAADGGKARDSGGKAGGGKAGSDSLFSVEKLRAMATFVDFLLQRPPRQAAAPAPPPQQQQQLHQAAAAPPAATDAQAKATSQALATRRAQPSRAAVLSALRAAVWELRTGCSLPALAALERAVAGRLADAFALHPPPLPLPSAPVGSTSGGEAAGSGGGGSVFAALGLGGSLLSALEAAGDGELVAAVAGDAEGPARAPLYQVLELVAEVLRSCRLATNPGQAEGNDSTTSSSGPGDAANATPVAAARAAAVSRALCRHYGVRRVEALGHGPVGHLVRLAMQGGATPPLGWHTAVALAPQAPPSETGDPAAVAGVDVDAGVVVGALGGQGRGAALAALCAAPELSDLRLATQWDAVFEAELGPLEEFLRAEGAAAGVAALELPSPPTGGPTLELAAGGRIIKLPYGATAADVVSRAAAGDARGVAAALLSVVAAGGGVGGCPAGLLARHLGEAMLDMARQAASRSELAGDAGAVVAQPAKRPAASTGRPGATPAAEADGPGAAAACHFVLCVLPHLPLPLMAPLAEAVLLPALATALERSSSGNASTLGGLTLGSDGMEGPDSQSAQAGVDIQRDVAGVGGVPGSAVHEALMRHVLGLNVPWVSGVARSCLHHLGFSLGVEAWQEDWRRLYGTASDESGDRSAADAVAAAAAATVAATAALVAAGAAEAGAVAGADTAAADADMEDAETQPSQPRQGAQIVAPAAAEAAPFRPECPGATVTPTAAADGAMVVAPGPGPVESASGAATIVVLPEASMDEEECRRFVESLRREEFGLGVSLEGEAAALSGRLAARTGRALQRLAAELYSTDSHFVMELVQNADDNAYPAGVVPTLEFVLQRGAILAANNELGFAPHHLRALCDVGASTKARVTGYIGQKGIGFKSVFRVSAAPQVHSRNFHVAFDLTRHGSLGYCLPDWCALPPGSATAAALTRLGCAAAAAPPMPLPDADTSSGPADSPSAGSATATPEAYFPYGTAIVLPLRQDMAGAGADAGAGGASQASSGAAIGASAEAGAGSERGAVLRRRFADLSPTLLLFLQRLQRIRVRDETAAAPAVPASGGAEAGGAGDGGDGTGRGGSGVRVFEMERRALPGHPHLVQLLVRSGGAAPEFAQPVTPSGVAGSEATSTITATTWAVVTASLQPSVPRAGVLVSETQVSLAFCLGQQTQGAAAGPSINSNLHGGGPDPFTGPALCLEAPSWRGGRPPQQPVFAYLPLRSYGLRFVVQGDWVVPSSREALDADSPWNQVLRAQLPGLFLRALDVFKGLPPPSSTGTAADGPSPAGNGTAPDDGSTGAMPRAADEAGSSGGRAAQLFWVDQWLRCVPLEGEAQGFFAGLPHSIATLLRAAPCIPVAGGGWAAPGDTAVCSAALPPDLLSRLGVMSPAGAAATGGGAGGADSAVPGAGLGLQAMQAVSSGPKQPLLSVLGLRLVAPEARVLYESRQLRALLGVREFGPAQLLDALRTLVRGGSLARGEVGLPWLATALVALLTATVSGPHGYHAGYPSGEGALGPQQLTRGSLLRELRSLPVLPLLGGGWASIEELRSSPQQHRQQQGGDPPSTSAGLDPQDRGECGGLFFPLPTGEGSLGDGQGAVASANPKDPASDGSAAVALLRRCSIPPESVHRLRLAGDDRTAGRSLLHFLDERLLAAAAAETEDADAAVAAPCAAPLRPSDAASRAVLGQQRRLVLFRGLEELGVRHMQPEDVVMGLALPALTSDSVLLASGPAGVGAAALGTDSGPTKCPDGASGDAQTCGVDLLVSCLAMPLLAGMLGPTAGAGDERRGITGLANAHIANSATALLGAGVPALQSQCKLLQRLRQRCRVLTTAGPRVLSQGLLLAQPPERNRSPSDALPDYAAAAANAQGLAATPGGGSGAVYLPTSLLPAPSGASAAASLQGLADILPFLQRPGEGGGGRGGKRGTGRKAKAAAGKQELVQQEEMEEWPLLADAYVQLFSGLVTAWRWLFSELGVVSFPRPVRTRLLLTAAQLDDSPWRHVQRGGAGAEFGGDGGPLPGPGPWVIDDWFCPALLRLLRLATGQRAILRADGSGARRRSAASISASADVSEEAVRAACERLCMVLAANWEHFAPAMEARLVLQPASAAAQDGVAAGSSDARVAAADVLRGTAPAAGQSRSLGTSSLASALRSLAWLPAVSPAQATAAVTGESAVRRALLRPTEVYAPLTHIRRLLGDHVPYVDLPGVSVGGAPGSGGGGSGTCMDVMLSQLGVVSHLTPHAVLRLLSSWSRGGMGPSPMTGEECQASAQCQDGGRFTTYLATMAGLYAFLEAHLQRRDAEEAATRAAGPGPMMTHGSAPAARRAEAGPSQLSRSTLAPEARAGHREATRPGNGGVWEAAGPEAERHVEHCDLLEDLVRTFEREALIWLPDDPRVGSLPAGVLGDEAPFSSEAALVPGRFYRCDEVVLRDPASVLDGLAVTATANARNGLPPPSRLLPAAYQPQPHRGGQHTDASAGSLFARLAAAQRTTPQPALSVVAPNGSASAPSPASNSIPPSNAAGVRDENAIDLDLSDDSDAPDVEEIIGADGGAGRGQTDTRTAGQPTGATVPELGGSQQHPTPLLADEPSVTDYLSCLSHIAAAAAASPACGEGGSFRNAGLAPASGITSSLTCTAAALRIIAHWARQHAAGRLGSQQLDQLRRGLQQQPLLPCTSGRWCRLGPAVLLDDDPFVAQALAGAAGLELALLPPDGGDGAQRRRAVEEFASARVVAGDAEGGAAAALLEALGVRRLSRCVSFRVEAGGTPLHGSVVEAAVREAVLAAESQLAAMLPDPAEFRALQDAVGEVLPTFRVDIVPAFKAALSVDVTALQAAAKLPLAAPSRAPPTVTVEPPALMVGPVLYVRVGASTNFTAISRELSRLFRGGTPWPALAERLLGALLTAAAGGDVAQLLAHQGVPPLPPPPPSPLPSSAAGMRGASQIMDNASGAAERGAGANADVRVRRWQLPPPTQPPPPPALQVAGTTQAATQEAERKKKRQRAVEPPEGSEQHVAGSGGGASGDGPHKASDLAARSGAVAGAAAGSGQTATAASRKRRRTADGDGKEYTDTASSSSSGSSEDGSDGEGGEGPRAPNGKADGTDGGGESSSSMSLASSSPSDSSSEETDAEGAPGEHDVRGEEAVAAAAAPPAPAAPLSLAMQPPNHPGQGTAAAHAAAAAVGAVTYQQPTGRGAHERMRAASDWWSRSQQRLERERQRRGGASPEEDARVKAIGRWGEELVFRHLVRQLEEQQQQRRRAEGGPSGGSPYAPPQQQQLSRAGSVAADRVVWVNRERESYLPYDMYISHADESVTYIEVKASASAAKDLFEISLAELRFAEEQGDHFVLYRVRGAGGPNPAIVRLEDPVRLLRQHTISLCLAV